MNGQRYRLDGPAQPLRDGEQHPFLREPVSWQGAFASFAGAVLALGLAFAIVLGLGATFMHHVAVAVP